MNENPDTDEIGLTEEEIKEITGDDSLDMDAIDLDDTDTSPSQEMLNSEKLKSGAESQNDPTTDLMEEIDLSDLDSELDTIDLETEQKLKVDEDLEVNQDLEINDKFHFDDDLEAKLKKAQKSKNLTPPPTSDNLPVNNRTKIATPPSKKTVKTTIKLKSKSVSPLSDSPSWEDPQKMKELFKYLDELLGQVPQEKLQEFALSKEYKTYFSLLKKLEI